MSLKSVRKPLGNTIWVGERRIGHGLEDMKNLLTLLRVPGLAEQQARIRERPSPVLSTPGTIRE